MNTSRNPVPQASLVLSNECASRSPPYTSKLANKVRVLTPNSGTLNICFSKLQPNPLRSSMLRLKPCCAVIQDSWIGFVIPAYPSSSKNFGLEDCMSKYSTCTVRSGVPTWNQNGGL